MQVVVNGKSNRIGLLYKFGVSGSKRNHLQDCEGEFKSKLQLSDCILAKTRTCVKVLK